MAALAGLDERVGVTNGFQCCGILPFLFQKTRSTGNHEAKPAIILGFTVALANLIGNAIIAGAVGGGLGDLGIRFEYEDFSPGIMAAALIIWNDPGQRARPVSGMTRRWQSVGHMSGVC
jgi:hypothetical protein